MAGAEGQTNPLARYEPLLEDPEAFRDACRCPLPKAVRVNTLRTEPSAAVVALREEGIGVDPVPWDPTLLLLETDDPGTTWPYVQGWLHGQEVVSALPAPILDPDPDDTLLDLCAAPGSKTSHLAALTDDRGILVANDVDLGRLSALRSNLDRLGVTSAMVTNRDGRHLEAQALDIEEFDGALVDVPCSCEGTIRKNPNALADWSEDYLAEISTVQRALLARAIRLTKRGGTVVYSTCTFAPEENEGVLTEVLSSESCRMVPVDLPIESRPGITSWEGETFDPAVKKAARVYPHLNDTGGFFIGALEVTG